MTSVPYFGRLPGRTQTSGKDSAVLACHGSHLWKNISSFTPAQVEVKTPSPLLPSLFALPPLLPACLLEEGKGQGARGLE